ncbi:MAG: alpha/beta fold hydrolase, partial [Fimbriiglobus sp.]
MNRPVTDPTFVLHRGCRLAYRDRGTGPPVLFIQGVGTSGDAWEPQVAGLGDRFRCLTFDNRGVGRSVPTGDRVTVPQMAEDAVRVLDAAGVRSAHVVGHSLGGLIALELALAARDRVRSLTLLCTFSRGRDVTRPTAWMLWAGLRTRIGTRRMRRNAFLRILLPPDAYAAADTDKLAADLAPLFGHDLAVQPPVGMTQLRAMARHDVTDRLPELTGLRTLVMSAAQDRIAPPACGQNLAGRIPGSRYVQHPDAAHGLPLQFPARVNEQLAEHF